VLYSVDDYYTVQADTPSLSASAGDRQSTVHTEHFALGPLAFTID